MLVLDNIGIKNLIFDMSEGSGGGTNKQTGHDNCVEMRLSIF